jgi:hypothetical protein
MMPSMCSDLPLAETCGMPCESSWISDPWQSPRSHETEGVCCDGGMPWHAPHVD